MMIGDLVAQVTVDRAYDLTWGGWIVMIASVGFVTALLAWCVGRVMRESTPEKLHSQVDVDTRDSENNS